jgi:hypothetical protein
MAAPSKHIVDSPTRDSDLVHASLLVISNARPSLLRPGIEKPIDFFCENRRNRSGPVLSIFDKLAAQIWFFFKKIKFSKKTKVDFKIFLSKQDSKHRTNTICKIHWTTDCYVVFNENRSIFSKTTRIRAPLHPSSMLSTVGSPSFESTAHPPLWLPLVFNLDYRRLSSLHHPRSVAHARSKRTAPWGPGAEYHERASASRLAAAGSSCGRSFLRRRFIRSFVLHRTSTHCDTSLSN